MQGIRIIELPTCKMVSSGIGMFGQEKFNHFYEWFSALPKRAFSYDFLFWDEKKNGFHWLYIYDEYMNVPSEFEIIDFEGGLYAVATDIDQHTNVDEMNKEVIEFLEANGFAKDNSRPELGNIITPLSAQAFLKYNQMDYYKPIIPKGITPHD